MNLDDSEERMRYLNFNLRVLTQEEIKGFSNPYVASFLPQSDELEWKVAAIERQKSWQERRECFGVINTPPEPGPEVNVRTGVEITTNSNYQKVMRAERSKEKGLGNKIDI